MDHYTDVIKLTFLLPFYTEDEDDFPDQLIVRKKDDNLIFVSKLEKSTEYRWKILDKRDHDEPIFYRLFSTNIIINNNNADVVLECFFPNYYMEKVGLHYSYSCSAVPFIPLIIDFRSRENKKSIHYFDHNIIDFKPKININNKNNLKVLVFRPTFKKNHKEITCLAFVEY